MVSLVLRVGWLLREVGVTGDKKVGVPHPSGCVE